MTYYEVASDLLGEKTPEFYVLDLAAQLEAFVEDFILQHCDEIEDDIKARG